MKSGARRGVSTLVRPLVRRLRAYVPGEQPKEKGLTKLNTNENPYPPHARVLKVVREAVDGRLRLYPNPTAQPLRQRLALLHRCAADNLIVGNGSDELLALASRAFVEPMNSRQRRVSAKQRSRETIQYFWPSYSLYPVLGEIAGARLNSVPLAIGVGLPSVERLRRDGCWDFGAALTYLTTPNAPSGRGYSTRSLDALCRAHRGVLILDEAYVDFAEENAMELALKHPHVLVSRTFSKAYSLCFQRVGYFVGHPELIGALDKIRDSYNVNGLGQAAALAALEEGRYYRANFERIVRWRERLSGVLTRLGFSVFPSQTNFVLARPPGFAAVEWLQRLRRRGILVRWFNSPEVRDYLRITIGTDQEMRRLVRAVKAIIDDGRRAGV